VRNLVRGLARNLVPRLTRNLARSLTRSQARRRAPGGRPGRPRHPWARAAVPGRPVPCSAGHLGARPRTVPLALRALHLTSPRVPAWWPHYGPDERL